MALFVNTNLASLNAQRHLAESQSSLNTSLERLSSGLRINNAYDDAAGLAIADKLQRDTRVTAQAIRNANDGLSALAIGEKSLGQVTSIVTRLSELASESSTGTVTNTQRSAIQNEFTQLLSEIDRISKTATFNGVSLLSGGAGLAIQVGLDGGTTSQINVSTIDAQLSALGIEASTIAVSTSASAQSSLSNLTSAIATIANNRGSLGAYESRLITAIANLQVASEQFSAAESRIRDADVAAEAANLTRGNILQQAGVAVLAQANQAPSVALQLLR
jgi:flagellin